MATSEFKIFANGQSLVGEETLNIAALDDEQLVTETKTGFYSGLASSKKFNRVLRQGTAGTATIADLIVEVLAEDVKDDGTPLKDQLRRAITKTVELDSNTFVRTINGKAPDASGDAVGGDTLNIEVLAACDKALADTVQTTGQTEIAQVMSAVAGVETLVDSKVPKSCPYVIEAWRSEDGASWYRKYSDGFIEQGGRTGTESTWRTVSLPLAMTTTTYEIFLTSLGYGTDIRGGTINPTESTKTKTSFQCVCMDGNERAVKQTLEWRVSGF